MQHVSAILCGAVLVLAAQDQQPVRLERSKLVDLTHPFDETAVYWPTAAPFRWEKEHWGPSPGGYWYAAGRYAASEHGGTHIDSPIHFGKGQAGVDEIPVTRLIAPAVVIDISSAAVKDRDYTLSAADVAAWEKTHGRIPERSIVLVRTGWGRYWPDRRKYLGSDKPGDVANLHFPGLSKAAAAALAQRKVDGVGIDTASLDPGPSKDFIAHQVLNGSGVYGLENVANLDRLPPAGAWLIALPMKIKGGSGAPVRIVAVLP